MSKKSWYVLRIVAGLYLAYLGIDLIRNVMAQEPKNKLFMIFMAVIFLIVGVLYAASSIKKVWAMRNETAENNISEIAEDNDMDEDDSEEQDTDDQGTDDQDTDDQDTDEK